MKTILKISLGLCLVHFYSLGQSKATISGYVREEGSKEHLLGVNVYSSNTKVGTSTNNYGFYSLTLPKNTAYKIVYSYVGYVSIEKDFFLSKDTLINISIASQNYLEELVVSNKKTTEKISETAQMSQIEVPIEQIKKIPTLLGEKDVLKVLQLMPGVQKGSEGQTGIYVRGGGPDQNLIILDDATVYNANHLFGFFSVFNGDALKSVELTKGGFPARFGGRLSSVIDLNMKEGNKEKIHGEAGIGLISSRFTLEGPIKKNKSSFLISGRRTYLDILARPIIKKASDGEGIGGYFFYDFNAKFNYEINDKNKIYLSGYFGKDKFYAKGGNSDYESDNGLNWGNATATLRWNHQFNQKLFSNTSLIFTDYAFNIFSLEKNNIEKETFSLNYQSAIRDFGLKYDLDYFPCPKLTVKFGIHSTFHRFNPSAIVLKDNQEEINRAQVPIQALENGIYVENLWNLGTRLKVNYGLRLSNYQVIGRTITKPEPRISVAYTLNHNIAFKTSYAQMNQYVHLLANSGLGLPTDLWVPSTKKVNPQFSEQLAIGLAKDFPKAGLSLTLEAYSKKMNEIISYKEGSSFTFFDEPESAATVPSWEDNVTAGKGWSNGLELMLQRKSGKLSGWIAYTLSKTEWQFEELNFGRKFFPRYDRRHDLSIVGIYELSKRITLSSTWVFGTGNALTIPIGSYSASTPLNPYENFGNSEIISLKDKLYNRYPKVSEYGEKNSFRAENYHRLDFGVQFHKKKKRFDRTLEFSVYNLYNRRNPFFYQISERFNYQARTQTTSLVRYSIFPIVPSFSWNIKF